MRSTWQRHNKTAQVASTGSRGRVVSLSMVKNEQDIVEPFLRHNARFVECMVVIDNGSVDDTRRIAMDCARELGNIVVVDSPDFAFTQSERMTRLLQYSQGAFFADFMLLLDADEFLSVPDRGALLSALEDIPAPGVGLIPWRTFVLKPDEITEDRADPPRSMRWRRVQEQPLYRKAVLRLDGAYERSLVVEPGNHWVSRSSGEPLPTVDVDSVSLLHFPVRSRGQVVAKGVVGWMAHLARNPDARSQDFGYQKRDIFDRVAGGVPLETDELCLMSVCYAQDRAGVDWESDVVEADPPSAYQRRYSDGSSADPFRLIVRSWEQSLASANPPLASLHRPSLGSEDRTAGETAFDADWHWQNLFVDTPPFQYIAEKYRPGSVLDIGCGVGAYLDLFRKFGTSTVLGVDGIPLTTTVLAPSDYLTRDLAEPLDLGTTFDVVICVEVAEHVQDNATLLDSIARHARGLVVFSAAEPGQPGHGHVNCQPLVYWLDHWASRGWRPDLVDTLGMRCLANLSWFRRNLVVLRREEEAGDDAVSAEAILAGIAARRYGWYAQAPGIRHTAFAEPIPHPRDAYSD